MEDEMELTAKQLAEAFGVQPGTISKWKTTKRLVARKPGGANRMGLRAKLSDVYRFIDTVPEDDREYTKQQFDRWLERYRAQANIQDPSQSDKRTLVLTGSRGMR